jgi:hypothetical protein
MLIEKNVTGRNSKKKSLESCEILVTLETLVTLVILVILEALVTLVTHVILEQTLARLPRSTRG